MPCQAMQYNTGQCIVLQQQNMVCDKIALDGIVLCNYIKQPHANSMAYSFYVSFFTQKKKENNNEF